MAFGAKGAGGLMSTIGAGLSFIPGPWSAVGIALTAAGGITSAVGGKKEAEKAAQEQEPEQQTAQAQPAEEPESRTEQGQLEGNQNPPVTMPGLNQNGFQPQQTGLGGYQSQIDAGIANLLLRDIDPGGL